MRPDDQHTQFDARYTTGYCQKQGKKVQLVRKVSRG